MKGMVIMVEGAKVNGCYSKLTTACEMSGVSYNTVTAYFRRYPKAMTYTHPKTGITLTKTELK
jgi:hypothetical protein